MNTPESLISLIEDKTGFFFDETGKKSVLSILKKRVTSSGLNSELLYFNYIKSIKGNRELESLISDVTVGETYFFRNKGHWSSLKNFVIPEIIDLKNGVNSSLKIWSAGCSSGEEPFTIAMVLKEESMRLRGITPFITATDIDILALSRGEKGLYRKNSFRGVDQHLINKYFTSKNEYFKINQEIRDMVKFKKLNLTSPIIPHEFADFDIIFCRNVLMYFRKNIQKEIINKLINSLKENCFLFLGHSESIIAKGTKLVPVNCQDAFVYQKKSDKKNRSLKLKTYRNKIILPPEVNKFKKKPDEKKISKKRENKSKLPAQKRIIKPYNYSDSFNLFLNENFVEALEKLQKKNEELDFKDLVLSTMIYINMSDFDSAEKYYYKTSEISDTQPEVHVLDAIIKESQKDYKNSIKSYKKAIFLDNNFFTPWFRLGEIFQTTGQFKKASQNYRNALSTLFKDDENRIKLFCGNLSIKFLTDICKQRI